MSIPNDPVILLSYLNTQLRDNYSSLREFCAANAVEESGICTKLAAIDYHYDEDTNQFS